MTEKITVSLIKADVGSIAGHSRPHPKMMQLYAAGQALLADAFSGNGRGMGPGAAEMEFVERPTEPMLVFMADKCGPAAYSLPVAKIFMAPFTTTGLVIDPRAHLGYDLEIVDVVDHKKVLMSSPAELYDILALIGDTTRYAVKRVLHRTLGIAAVISTEKLTILAGKYVGKDDPVMLVRCQSGFPAVGEVLQPFAFPHLVEGWMRGSHHGPLMPCAFKDAIPSRFDGPPRVIAAGYQLCEGKLLGPMAMFADVAFDEVRT